jgi:hypothetical protein
MPLNNFDAHYFRSDSERLEQGDLLRDVSVVEWAEVDEVASEIQIRERNLPYCVVLSQDCDLEHDFNAHANQDRRNTDKYLQSILVCPAYPDEPFRQGIHLDSLGLVMESHRSEQWRQIKSNNVSRYYYLVGQPNIEVPNLVVDFKHYVTIPRDIVYRPHILEKYLATIEVLFRDNLSARFAHYLSRIGLPDLRIAAG